MEVASEDSLWLRTSGSTSRARRAHEEESSLRIRRRHELNTDRGPRQGADTLRGKRRDVRCGLRPRLGSRALQGSARRFARRSGPQSRVDQTTRKQRHATLIPKRDASVRFPTPRPTPALARHPTPRRCMRRAPSLSRFAHLARWCSKPPHASAPARSPVFLLQQPPSPIRTAYDGATDAKRSHMTRPYPPASFSRSQSWASQARSDATADYVEDSEPEREERRIQAAKTRGVKRKKTPVLVVPNLPGDVIELTDSSPSRPTSPAHRLTNVQSAPLVIIDVSGEPQPQ